MRFLVLTLFLILSCSTKKEKEVKEAQFQYSKETKALSALHSVHSKAIQGFVTIEDLPQGIQLTADLTGLPVNSTLGFHIHQEGICEGPDYKSAGEHFNPYHKNHGKPDNKHKHMGDLGNLVTDAKGHAKKVILIPRSEIKDINLIIGKSILVHEKADDFKTQPSGNSGARIACGLIGPV